MEPYILGVVLEEIAQSGKTTEVTAVVIVQTELLGELCSFGLFLGIEERQIGTVGIKLLIGVEGTEARDRTQFPVVVEVMIDEQRTAPDIPVDIEAFAHIKVCGVIRILRHTEIRKLRTERRAGVVVMLIVEDEVDGGVVTPPGGRVTEGERFLTIQSATGDILDEAVMTVIVEGETVGEFALDDRRINEACHLSCVVSAITGGELTTEVVLGLITDERNTTNLSTTAKEGALGTFHDLHTLHVEELTDTGAGA